MNAGFNKDEHAFRDEVREFCSHELAPYKVPFEVEFIPELPKSSVMKVLRRELRDMEIRRRKDSDA